MDTVTTGPKKPMFSSSGASVIKALIVATGWVGNVHLLMVMVHGFTQIQQNGSNKQIVKPLVPAALD